MAVQIIGNGGVVLEVDEARNQFVWPVTIPGYPTAGGYYAASGGAAANVAAALAANTMLMSARMATGSTRKAYIWKMRITMLTTTVGAAGGVPSLLGIQRFTAQTPTGGTQRTAARLAPAKGSASDITDIRDSNAALTGTAPTFGDVLAQANTPTGGTLALGYEWIFEPFAPVELSAGDGIALRTQTVGPATATWVYSYTLHWFER
jgi:hypothetical protein